MRILSSGSDLADFAPTTRWVESDWSSACEMMSPLPRLPVRQDRYRDRQFWPQPDRKPSPHFRTVITCDLRPLTRLCDHHNTTRHHSRAVQHQMVRYTLLCARNCWVEMT
ncbi:hypothetical protein J6590_095716 [Homalodisca vitripennis]|nr:hypothetical protein J6590_011094 [Homalodisca vitripennis]KAG8289863.1 hypothetical protein J6590_095716 [Homalodisca vitripennis]